MGSNPKNTRKMKSKTSLQVILSDLHIGSTVGLWPENFVSNEGNPIGQNRFQNLLWKHWLSCKEWIAETVGYAPFELIINGDLVDGIHHRTLQVMTADVGDQSAATVQTLQGLADKAAALYITKGTECHTRNDELRIGRDLGAVKDPSTGQAAWDRLELVLSTGKVLSATHHMPATKRTYLEAGMLSIELQNEVSERHRNGLKPPDIIARAHRHTHGVYSNGRQMALVTGAWQGLTRYGYKVVPHGVPAASCIILDTRNRGKGELPLVHEKLFINQ